MTEPIVRVLHESGERTITIAPETGSDRLRRVINKTVTNDEILDRADVIFAAGIENLKLYYMIGLPTETDDDLVAIRELTLKLRERMLKYARSKGHVGRIIASVNPLIPKPGTAYQWLPMTDPSLIDRQIKRLRALTAGIDNCTSTSNPSGSRTSRPFCRSAIVASHRLWRSRSGTARTGARRSPSLASTRIPTCTAIARTTSRCPDIIDGGMKASFFHSEYEKGLREEWTLPPKRAAENARLLPML